MYPLRKKKLTPHFPFAYSLCVEQKTMVRNSYKIKNIWKPICTCVDVGHEPLSSLRYAPIV
jgi:hypothetical protein